MTRVTFFRRMLGVFFAVAAPLIYVHEARKGTFACERVTGTCLHTVARVTGAVSVRTTRLSDVLGVSEKHAYWDEAPGAREALARARRRDDVSAETLWVTKPSSGRRSTASSTTVVLTRQGLVFVLPGRSAAYKVVSGFERFLAGEGDRYALIVDDRFSSLPLPLIFLGIGVIVIRFRGPDPPRRTE